MKTFLVGTFYEKERRPELLRAYSAYSSPRSYLSSWPGCIEYTIEAENGNDARRKAVLMRRDHEVSRWNLREAEMWGHSGGQGLAPTGGSP